MSLARSGVVVALGFFALTAQTLLFRDYLSVLEGNELAVGAFFSAWLAWIAAGAWAGRTVARRRPAFAEAFDLVSLIYLPAWIIQHLLLTHARYLAGLEAHDIAPFGKMAAVALFANAPTSFATGFLFTLACAGIFRNETPVSRVYILEAFGGFLGGSITTILLALGIPTQGVFLFSAALLGASAAANRAKGSCARLAVFAAFAAIAPASMMLLGMPWTAAEDRAQWSRLMPRESFRGAFSTAQARYLFGEREGQFVVISGTGVVESAPGDEHAGEIAASHLAQNPEARSVLIIGNGGLSLGSALRRLKQIETVVWLHADMEYPKNIRNALPDGLRRMIELIGTPATDVMRYLRSPGPTFDIAILSLPDTASLSLNRYSSMEFFGALKSRLADGGVIGVRIHGGENYLGGELALIGASMQATLETQFPHTIIKPGEESWIIASSREMTSSPLEMTRRYAAIAGWEKLYPAQALATLFPDDRMAFQNAVYRDALNSAGTAELVNTEKNPKALLFNALLAARLAGLPAMSDRLPLFRIVGLAGIIAAIFFYGLLRHRYIGMSEQTVSDQPPIPKPRPFDAVALAGVAGFGGMALCIVLMYGFQSRHGSLFLYIGLISALFMLGMTAGGVIMEKLAPGRIALLTALAGVAFSCGIFALAFVPNDLGIFLYAILFVLGGFFSGMFFPLADARLRIERAESGDAGGLLESVDHLGGVLGASATGLWLLPFLGVATTLRILAAVIAVGALASLLRTASTARRTGDAADEAMRIIGFVLFGIAAVMLTARFTADRASENAGEGAFADAAAQMIDLTKSARDERKIGQDAMRFFRPKANIESNGPYVYDAAPSARNIAAYGGPISLAAAVDAQGKLLDFRIMKSRETPVYLEFLRPWMESLKGRNLAVADPFSGIDAVSGATVTSKALKEILTVSGRQFTGGVLGLAPQAVSTEDLSRRPSKEFFILIGFLFAALFLRRYPNPHVRRAYLAIVAIVCGLWLNLQYSTQHVFSLGGSRPAVSPTAPFFIVFVIPAAVVLFGNVYCGGMCPFGALQELAGELRPKGLTIDPDKSIRRYGRFVKYILLFIIAVFYALAGDFQVLAADPLTDLFSRMHRAAPLAFGAALLVAAVFHRRFWCRNLCPAGAFLSILRGVSLRLFNPAKKIAQCDMGVGNAHEPDCLDCDRCRYAKK